MQGGLGVHDGAGLGGRRDGAHSAAEAGETPHVPTAVVREAEGIAAAVHQRGVVDEVDRTSVIARGPPARTRAVSLIS